MLRKTLTILSLVGLLLSLGLWGVSYLNLNCTVWRPLDSGSTFERKYYVGLRYGGLSCWTEHRIRLSGSEAKIPPTEWQCEGFTGWRTDWRLSGRLRPGVDLGGPTVSWFVPFWIPTTVFAAWPTWMLMPWCRRRNRRKLGMCVKCGYDLRGSKDRCPECGAGFSN